VSAAAVENGDQEVVVRTEGTERGSARSARPTCIDLFGGAGGLSLGFEQAGFDVLATVEYDPVHALAHRYNFPASAVLCRDVRQLAAEEVMSAASIGFRQLRPREVWNGDIDVVVGGPSCQGFSTGGLRNDDDERNGLLAEFVRLVVEIRPRAFCLENVPGLLEPRFAYVRLAALKTLRGAGYSITGGDGWLNAADFGVPQNRKRVFVVGVLDGPAPDLPEPVEDRAFVTVGQALEGLPVVEDYPALLLADDTRLHLEDSLRRASAGSGYARALAGLSDRADLSRPRLWDPSVATCSLRTVHSPDVVRRFTATAPGSVESKSRLYRLDPDTQARTLRAGTGRERGAHTAPRPIHPELPRAITVREAARLHGYPDWFRFSGTNWHGHRQVGNSVPPPLARAVAAQLIKALGAKPRRLRTATSLGEATWCRTSPVAAAALLSAVADEGPAQRARLRPSTA
jgi:DNA (cytosine-5)-methyltransferase 1